jgi:RNA polymerase sigma-70 factor (ECF subfamily)
MAADPIPIRTEELLAHAGWLRALARSLVADPATADDLVQDTWVAALRHPPDRSRPLRPWLARVVQNLARNRRRGDVRRSEREAVERPDGEAISPDKIAAEVEAQRMLADAVLKLDEPLRTTVVLRYFRGMNASEIAAAQLVPAGTVRWRLMRAIELLRADLDGRYDGRRESWCVALAGLVPRKGTALATSTATLSSATTGVWIMSTSTKIGIAAALALCLGVATWKLAGSEEPRTLFMDDMGYVIEEPRFSAPIDAVAESSAREALIPGSSPLPESTAHLPALGPIHAQECCIVGRVLDTQGRPLANVVLAAIPTDVEEPGLLDRFRRTNDPARAKTNAAGVFSLQVPSATPCAVVAEIQAFAPRAISPCFAGQVIEIVLTEGTRVNVRVVSRQTSTHGSIDTPIEGAFVQAWATAEGQPNSYWWGTASSNAQGEAVLLGAPPGPIRIEARMLGFVPSDTRIESFGVGSMSCELALAVPSALEGVVLDRKTRLPIPNASVAVDGKTGIVADSSGRYRLAAFSAGTWTHSVGSSADGYAPSFTYVDFAESGVTKRHDFELEHAQRVRGRVVEASGAPISGASVSYSAGIRTEPFLGETHRGVVESQGDGSFELRDLHPETAYRIVVTATGHGARVLNVDPLATGSMTMDIGDIELSPPSSIAGLVEGQSLHDGSHIVRLHANGGPDDDRSRLGSTRPDPRGRFVFDSLGAGRYRVELVTRTTTGTEKEERVVVSRTIELRAGESTNDVVLRASSAEIRGRVVGPDGSALGDCRVRLFGAESASEPIASTYTSVDGRFQLPTDAEGPLRLFVDDPRLFHDSRTVDGVQPGGDEISITLEAFRSTFTIRGRVIDASGKSPERVYVAFTDTTTKERLSRVALPDEAGRFDMNDLRDVAYDLELVDFGNLYKPVKVANVKPSGEDVVLHIERRE